MIPYILFLLIGHKLEIGWQYEALCWVGLVVHLITVTSNEILKRNEKK